MSVRVKYYVLPLLLILPHIFLVKSLLVLRELPSHVIHNKDRLQHSSSWLLRSAPSTVSERNEGQPLTIQILMSDTGGGHRASANALRDAFDTLYPGKIQCDIVDIFTEYGPFFPFNAFVPIYKIMAEYSFLWKWGYELSSTPFGLWFNEVLLEFTCFEAFQECMSRPIGQRGAKRADMVVSVHPLTQDIPLKILNYLDSKGMSRTSGRTTPFVTIVTDLGSAHPTWFNPGVDKCFVPTDALRQCARDRKLSPQQIVQYGLPIRKGFWADNLVSVTNKNAVADQSKVSPTNFWDHLLPKKVDMNSRLSESTVTDMSKTSKAAIQKSLQLTQNLPTVLIVGGGDGMGGIVSQAQRLGQKLQAKSVELNCRYQMVVVCGKNENAQAVLSSANWGSGLNVHVKGFVNNMDEWMKASDILVTKAGPGTIAEAAICGLPCMLSSYLPGQEEGNIPFVENAGFGSYSGDPGELADKVSEWLASPQLLLQMKENALKAARPNATLDIARDVALMLSEHKKVAL